VQTLLYCANFADDRWYGETLYCTLLSLGVFSNCSWSVLPIRILPFNEELHQYSFFTKGLNDFGCWVHYVCLHMNSVHRFIFGIYTFSCGQILYISSFMVLCRYSLQDNVVRKFLSISKLHAISICCLQHPSQFFLELTSCWKRWVSLRLTPSISEALFSIMDGESSSAQVKIYLKFCFFANSMRF